MYTALQLSPSKMGILRECPRCFWDANNLKFARPRGIFSSLPNGIDLVMKDYFNNFRGSLPPEIRGQVEGVLMKDLATLTKWRSWRTGLTYVDKALDVKLIGALDECLTTKEGLYIPLDYKTKGSEPQTDGSEYYQLQLDCYMLMLRHNGYKTAGKAYLSYFYPDAIPLILDDQGARDLLMFPFKVKVFEIACDADRAVEKIKEAVQILRAPRPEAAPDCEYCKFGIMYQRD
jgi:hypothetical protein